MPWIYKAQADGTIAADIDIYVDDMQLTAATKEQVWLASARMAKACAYLELQVAPRKKLEPDQTPGAWQGATVASMPKPLKTVTPERWEKTKFKPWETISKSQNWKGSPEG
jgi:hypothetical protein